MVALEPGLPVEQMPGGKAFEQAYQSRYHTHIELHAPFAYDATRVLVAAMEKADSVDPADYLPALRAINYAGKPLPARSRTARIFAALSRCSICGKKITPWRSRYWTPTTSSITTT